MAGKRMAGRGLTSRALGRAFCACIATTALGCTMEIPAEESNLGEERQPVEMPGDRLAAAAVGVGVNGTSTIREMWVFVCNSENVLKRRRKASWTSSWENWETASSIPCSGVPTAGAGQATPQDDVEVFYRSTSGHLIEVYYYPDGTRVEVDLTDELGMGNINGNPVIADMGTRGHVAVAYRRNPSNYLRTLSWTPGVGWSNQTTDANGVVGRSNGTITALYTTQQTYLAAAYDGVMRIYTRSNWADPYAQINASISIVTTQHPWCVLTFTAPTPTTMLALCRDSVNRVMKTEVVPGQAWDWETAIPHPVSGTPYMGGSWNYDVARNYDNDRGAGVNRWQLEPGNGTYLPLYGLDGSSVEVFDNPLNMGSGGTRPTNAGGRMDSYVFFVNEVNHLYEANLWQLSGSAASDMGIITLPP